MLKFEKSDIAFIKEYIENPNEILESNNVEDVLDILNVFIMVSGFDDDYNLTDVGRKAQLTYDNVYANNKVNK